MNLDTQRSLAVAAARSQLRENGFNDLHKLDTKEFLAVLDDLSISNPALIVSRWYLGASENQIKLFKKDIRRWKRNV